MRCSHFIMAMILGMSATLPTSEAQTTDRPAVQGTLLVANKGASTLGIVDPQSGQQVSTVAEGGITGHEVVAFPDGRTAYVPIYGNSGVGKPGTDGSNIVVIDIASRKVIGNIDFSWSPPALRRDWIQGIPACCTLLLSLINPSASSIPAP